MVDASRRSPPESDRSAEALLQWLATFKGFHNKLQLKPADDAGRGLFVNSKALHPGEPYLVIPAASLLNPLTLQDSALNSIPSELFPAPASTSTPPRRSSNGTPRLTTTQLLTLHIALTRDPQQRHKSEWQTFIDTLPEFRPLHPLTWVIPADDGRPVDPFWAQLESCLSESVRIKIAAVKQRYEDDLRLLRRVLRDEEPFKSQGMNALLSDETFMWAWLNVNTRTVSVPLGLSEPRGSKWPVNNHSFVPLLDMINHSSIPSIACPKPEPMPSSSITVRSRNMLRPGNHSLKPGKVDLVLCAPLRGLVEGEQVTFLYGPHSNAMLFAEYGFTEIEEEVNPLSWPNDDVDVMPWVEKLWDAMGSDEKREALEAAGMWDHNKMASNGGDPQPSIGLMTTLCVLNSTNESSFTPSNLAARSFSRVTKNAARRMLARICDTVLEDAQECREDLAQVAPLAGADKEKHAALAAVRGLLREEEEIARKVLNVVEGGGPIPGF